MDNQLFVCHEFTTFSFELINPIIKENDIFREGGLWTSSFTPGKGSNWLRCAKFPREYAKYYNGYLFEVKNTAKVYTIDNFQAEQQFKLYYKGNCANVAKEFDALHLDYNYVEGLKRQPKFTSFLSWSTESTWWFNGNHLEIIKMFNGEDLEYMLQN